jgi:hypothetical protein
LNADLGLSRENSSSLVVADFNAVINLSKVGRHSDKNIEGKGKLKF